MPNHQLAHAKYHFHDSLNERLMFRRQTQNLFHLEKSNVHYMSRKTDISQEPIDDLASKLINYGKESKEKDQF